jgi:quercetin dioxygenase-like cupin family protein
MRRTSRLAVPVAAAIVLGALSHHLLGAQSTPIKRTELLRTEIAGMDGKEAHMWVAEIAPGAATGTHRHPTARFVYVMEGSVVLEMEGRPPQTFTAGQGFMERPNTGHNFRNASTREAAKALGFQIASKGQQLQVE